jgi:hypothetical protein
MTSANPYQQAETYQRREAIGCARGTRPGPGDYPHIRAISQDYADMLGVPGGVPADA